MKKALSVIYISSLIILITFSPPSFGQASSEKQSKQGKPGWDNTTVPITHNYKANGYYGIWYYNQRSNDEYVYKYSGGLGTYCAKHKPFAVYNPKADKTFFCYGGRYKVKNQLLHMVSYYDHNTGMVPRPTILLDKKTNDAHDNPVISMDDKGYIWIFSSSHGTDRPSYIHKSKKPYDIDEFEWILTTNFSYTQPWYIKGKGFIFFQTKYNNPAARTLYCTTSPDGVHWSKPEDFAAIEHGHYQVSAATESKAGSAFNMHPKPEGLNWRTNLYYVETTDFGKTWQTVQGKKLETPLTEIKNPAIVHDYQSEELNVYMKDIVFDENGMPIILYITSKGYESGPKNDPRTWTTARWTGTNWEILPAMTSNNNYDMGSLYIEDGVWRIIAPTQHGPQKYNPGGEVAIWTSKNKGKNWKMIKQLTNNSKFNHTYVRRPVNAHPDFYAFWADGHGRKPSKSSFYFTNKSGTKVWMLPRTMKKEFEKPILIKDN